MTNTEFRRVTARGREASCHRADQWLPSMEAAEALGVSVRTLKRYGHLESGFLLPEVHWIAGAYANSPTRWDVAACRAVLHHRGIKARQEMRIEQRLPVLAGGK
jgi:hypothetical protein